MAAVDGTRIHPFPEEFKKFESLIYLPLDLEIPIVDEKEFLSWFEETHARDLASGNNESDGVPLNTDASKVLLPADNNKKIYPWNIVYLHRHQRKTANYEDCLNRFPSIKQYIDSLPFINNSSISILRQHPGVDVGIHTDFDLWFGIRFYLINSSKARIFFRKAKYPSNQRLTAWSPEGKRIPWENIVEDEKVYAEYPTPRCSFHLTCTHAVHGVEAVPEDIDCSRITFFFTGKLDSAKYAELIERSLIKYKDFAIWH